jgi:hypothetical protein
VPKKRKKKAAEKRRAEKWIARVVWFLRDADPSWEIRLARLRGDKRLCEDLGFDEGIVGCVDKSEKQIVLDHRTDLLLTLIHEILHVLLDPWKLGRRPEELKVLKLERLIRRHIDPIEAERILHLAVRHIPTDEPT